MESRNNKMAERMIAFSQIIERSSDSEVLSKLNNIRENGELYMIQPLIELLFSQRSNRVKETIISLLADLRDQKATPLIADSLRKNINNPEIHLLVSACWQSRLSFIDHLDLFTNLLCNAPLQTSFEAFTAIENMLDSFTPDERKKYSGELKTNQPHAREENVTLVKELIAIVETYEEGHDHSR